MRPFIAFIVFALALPRLAQADAFDWRPVNQEMAALLRGGSYDTALPTVLNSLEQCPQAVTPVEAALCTAVFSEDLATIREHQGDLPAAEAALRQTLASRTDVLPPTDPRVGEAHYLLAAFLQRQGRWEDAVASLRAAEAIARANGPAHEGELAGLLTRHAVALEALGRPAEAVPLYRQAHDMVSTISGPLSRDSLVTLGNLFSGQVNAGAPEPGIEAVTALLASPDAETIDPEQRALLAGKLALAVTGSARAKAAVRFVEAALPDLDNGLVTDADVSFALLNGAARLQAVVGDAARAVGLARRARDVAAGKWGPSSIAVSTALRTEAAAEAARHHPAAAVARLTEAAGMLTAPALLLARVQVQIELGQQLSRTGQREEAVAADMALAGSRTVAGAPPGVRAAVLTLIGDDLVRLQAFEQGGKMCRLAAELGTGQNGLSRDYPVKALLCVGNAAANQGRFADAADAALRARALLWEGIVAPAEPSAAFQIQIADLLARSLRDRGRNTEALAAYGEEMAIARKAGDVPSQGAILAQIAFIQKQMGLLKEAEQTSIDGLTLLGPDGPPRPRANLLNNRGQVAMQQGRAADAVRFFEASLALRRQEEAPETLAIASEERDLAAALAGTGRDAEAGRHMDIAIEGFRALGASRNAYLVVALDRRVAIATAAGDPTRAETALRELLSLHDPASDDAAAGRVALADLLDNQGRRAEATALRAEAVSIVVAKHGADSVEALSLRLTALPSLRAAGRLAEADAVARDCAERATAVHDVLLACLNARAETALGAGRVRDAAAVADKAVIEAESGWTRDSGPLVQALMLRIRAAAASGDSDGVLRLYDRVHGLTPDKGPQRGWTDIGEGRTLIQAGEPDIGLAMLRLALRQANSLHDAGMALAATGALAEHALSTGRGHEAIGLWQAVLPVVSEDDAPMQRVTVLEGLGKAANAIADYADAARLFQEAVTLCRTANGPGSPLYHRLVAAWADALTQSGEPARTEDALRLLNIDPSPAARRQQTIGLIHLAQASHDSLAAMMLGHQLVAQAENAFGTDSVAAAFARLDLIEITIGSGKHVDQVALDDALRVILPQDSSWHVALRTARIEGLLAAERGQFSQAVTAFQRAETIAIDNEGPQSLDAASEVSNQAGARLKMGDVTEADALSRKALAMASPGGAWRNPVWARIAGVAAAAAERSGDPERAAKLRKRADQLAPTVPERETIRWL
ncbi:MAG TPA: hypothetical protein DDZ81_06710 [Acetobacteraceae bacterium]|jgi:tetratricopeptide (TPR) repeat protein|nr:hypothetical protein [Acetobacteraceae bacterium]